MPSTSYAKPHSNHSLEYRQPNYHSSQNISQGSSRSTDTSFQTATNTHPRQIERKSVASDTLRRIKDNRTENQYIDNDYLYSNANNNDKSRQQGRRHKENTTNRINDRRERNIYEGNDNKNDHFQRNSDQFNARISPSRNQRNRDIDRQPPSNVKHEEGKDNVQARDRVSIHAGDSRGRRHSIDREGFASNRNDSVDNRSTKLEWVNRSPLISQSEAFKRQREEKIKREAEVRQEWRGSEGERSDIKFKDLRHEQSRQHITENSFHHHGSKRPITTPHRSRSDSSQISHHRTANDNYTNDTTRSPDHRGKRRRLENEQNHSPQRPPKENWFSEKREQTSPKNSETQDKKEYPHNKAMPKRSNKKYDDTYKSKDSKQERIKDKPNENSDQSRYEEQKNEPSKNKEYRSRDDDRGFKRKYSEESGESSQITKKGKHQPGIQRKFKKSNVSSRSGISKCNSSFEYKSSGTNDHSNCKDSDIDSPASSEAKRVSALARLGPKVTLNQRLSNLPKHEDDKELSKNASKDSIGNRNESNVENHSSADKLLTEKQNHR